MSSGFATDFVNDIFKQIENNAKKVCDECLKQAVEVILPEFASKLEEEYKKCANDFYGSYDPIYYYRMDTLLKMFRITEMDTGTGIVAWEFDDSESYYNTVFKLGYHGGAPHNGGYYWRKPYPWYNHWGRPAVRSASTYDMFTEKVDTLFEEYSNKLSSLWGELVEKNKGRIFDI